MTHTRRHTTMRPSKESRKYDILLLGASGYTGQLTADHIAAHLPTNLKWGISSTSRAKLETLAGKLKKEHPDRVQPGKVILLLCCSGSNAHCPYNYVIRYRGSFLWWPRATSFCHRTSTSMHQHSVVCNSRRAGCESLRREWNWLCRLVSCGSASWPTTYLDKFRQPSSAAIPSLVYTWVRKYHQQAQGNEVAVSVWINLTCRVVDWQKKLKLIHACGALITPVDVACWIGTRAIDTRWSLKTKDITFRLDELEYVLHAYRSVALLALLALGF